MLHWKERKWYIIQVCENLHWNIPMTCYVLKNHKHLMICMIFLIWQILSRSQLVSRKTNPSLVDVILANKSKSCFKSLNFNTGVSDCLHLISTVIKGNIPICENIKQPYRSFKNFDVDAYVNDLDKIRLLNESCDNVTDIDLEYDHFECEVSKVDKHVPVKHRYPKKYHIWTEN